MDMFRGIFALDEYGMWIAFAEMTRRTSRESLGAAPTGNEEKRRRLYRRNRSDKTHDRENIHRMTSPAFPCAGGVLCGEEWQAGQLLSRPLSKPRWHSTIIWLPLSPREGGACAARRRRYTFYLYSWHPRLYSGRTRFLHGAGTLLPSANSISACTSYRRTAADGRRWSGIPSAGTRAATAGAHALWRGSSLHCTPLTPTRLPNNTTTHTYRKARANCGDMAHACSRALKSTATPPTWLILLRLVSLYGHGLKSVNKRKGWREQYAACWPHVGEEPTMTESLPVKNVNSVSIAKQYHQHQASSAASRGKLKEDRGI